MNELKKTSKRIRQTKEDGYTRISIRLDDAAAAFYKKEAGKSKISLNSYLIDKLNMGAFIGQQRAFSEEIQREFQKIQEIKANEFPLQFGVVESLYFCETILREFQVANSGDPAAMAEKKAVEFSRKTKQDIKFINGVPEEILLAMFFCEAVLALYQNGLSKEKYELAVRLANRKAAKILGK